MQSPPYVNEKNVLSRHFIYFFFPTIADIGIPFDIALANELKSGVTPVKFWAPPISNLNPVIIS